MLHQLAKKKSEGSLCNGWHNAIPEESQLVGAIVTGDVQLGIVQPTGRPISVSTQRGFSLPGFILLNVTFPSANRFAAASGVDSR